MFRVWTLCIWAILKNFLDSLKPIGLYKCELVPKSSVIRLKNPVIFIKKSKRDMGLWSLRLGDLSRVADRALIDMKLGGPTAGISGGGVCKDDFGELTNRVCDDWKFQGSKLKLKL